MSKRRDTFRVWRVMAAMSASSAFIGCSGQEPAAGAGGNESGGGSPSPSTGGSGGDGGASAAPSESGGATPVVGGGGRIGAPGAMGGPGGVIAAGGSETGARDAGMTPPEAGGAGTDSDGGSPCTVTDAAALCASKAIVSITNGADTRRIYWNMPSGTPPARGWPAVVLYQGSIYGPSLSWDVSLPKSTGFGGYYQVALIARLLAAGFVVVQPEAQGGLAWNTNNGSDYDASPDGVFIPELLDDLASGIFGAVGTTHLYAAGISSGGYMTSRMAVSYPGRFRALAIESASYATCLGPLCTIPSTLPADHPPTLFLHGDADTIVPVATAKAYYDALVSEGIEAKFIEDPAAAHQWLDVSPTEVTRWFMTH